MSKGVLAVFAQTNTAASDALKSFTNSYQMPFITVTHPIHEYAYSDENQRERASENHSPSFPINTAEESISKISQQAKAEEDYQKTVEKKMSENFQFNMHPDLVPMLVSMIKYTRWKNIYYVYNHDEGIYYFLIKKLFTIFKKPIRNLFLLFFLIFLLKLLIDWKDYSSFK